MPLLALQNEYRRADIQARKLICFPSVFKNQSLFYSEQCYCGVVSTVRRDRTHGLCAAEGVCQTGRENSTMVTMGLMNIN